jgi:hypothetical protein
MCMYVCMYACVSHIYVCIHHPAKQHFLAFTEMHPANSMRTWIYSIVETPDSLSTLKYLSLLIQLKLFFSGYPTNCVFMEYFYRNNKLLALFCRNRCQIYTLLKYSHHCGYIFVSEYPIKDPFLHHPSHSPSIFLLSRNKSGKIIRIITTAR